MCIHTDENVLQLALCGGVDVCGGNLCSVLCVVSDVCVYLLCVCPSVLALVLLERMQVIVVPQLLEAQCRFRKGQSTVDQI